MDSGKNWFWGWIPILTTKIHFEFLIKEMEGELISISDKDKKLICDILKADEIEGYYREDFEDELGKTFKAIVCVHNYKINHVFMRDKDGVIKAHAKCSLHDDGIVEIKLALQTIPIREQLQPKVARRVYMIIRDIYHTHTHHEKHHDKLLNVVITNNKREAVEKLLTQFDEKIIRYHKMIKHDIENPKFFETAKKLITRAKGEMIYALVLTKLFEECFERPLNTQENTQPRNLSPISIECFEKHRKTQENTISKSYISVFSNSIKSIDVLAEEAESIRTDRITRALNALTLVIVALTAPIATDATYKILNKEILTKWNLKLTFMGAFVIAVFYTIIFVVTCIIMRDWIREEMERLKDKIRKWCN